MTDINPHIAEVAAVGERVAVINWLERQAVLCGQAANAAQDASTRMREVERARWYVLTARCVERGAHLLRSEQERGG